MTVTTTGGDDDGSDSGATTSTSSGATTSPTSTGATTGTAQDDTTDDPSTSTEPLTTTDSLTTEAATTEEPLTCGNGQLDPGEACDDGQETKLCDGDCTGVACGDAHVNEAAGEQCDDGNVDNTDDCLDDCTAPSCGDDFLRVGVEECDDGNTEPGDGCSETCTRERWSHVGVAHDVAVDDLYLWEPCWTDTYEAGALVTEPLDACDGDHLLVACRPVGSSTLTLAAHGPRQTVTAEVNYEDGERNTANGVDFYWSPYWEGVIGFGPEGSAYCYGNGPNPLENMCWKVGGNLPLAFVAGRQCGEYDSPVGGENWERIIYQAWD